MDLDLPPRFEVVGLLGRGGMGRVYEVFDRDRSETVALKTLDPGRAKHVAQIKGEFRVLAGISHPNVVTFHELFEHAGRWFFTMERVAGIELLAWVRGVSGFREETIGEDEATQVDDSTQPEIDEGTLDTDRLRTAVRQIARGLLAIHRAGRVHRDVKPSNVRVTFEGRVVLLDFGVAVTGGEVSRVGGTISYMAPEQAKKRAAVRPPADAYALGVLVYEALTGTVPFDGTPGEILGQKLELEPPPPSTRVDRPLPGDLEALTIALMFRNPDDRPTMLEVLEAIDERRHPRDAVPEERHVPLVGRDPLLGACFDAWVEAKRRGPVAISLTGPDGIGRTRALEEVAKALRAEDVTVVQTRADARESIPFRGLDPIVDMLLRAEREIWERGAESGSTEDASYVAGLFPSIHQLWPDLESPPRELVDPIEVRKHGFLALSRWLRRHAPLAVLIDDAHDLDGDGLALLTALLRPGRPMPLLVILAAREAPPLQTRELPISKLTDEEAHRLARALKDTGPIDEIIAAAQGRPGWLVQLTLEARSSLENDIGRAVRRRLDTLPPSARMLLIASVLAHSPLDIALASEVTGSDRRTVVADAQRLTASHLLRRDAALEVPSGIVRDAVRATVPTDTARSLHGSLARALDKRPRVNAELVARHFAAAGDRARAAALANRALHEAEKKLAFDRSANLADFLATLDPKNAGAHLTRKARALGYAGRGREAAEAYLDAVQRTEDPVRCRAMRRLAAKELIRSGHVDRGIEVLREALSDVGLSMPRDAVAALPSILLRRARLLLTGTKMRERTATSFELERIDVCWAACSLLAVDIYWAAYFQTLHLQYALHSGSPACAARALALEIPLLAAAGRSERASHSAAYARELVERADDAHAEGLVEGSIGFGLLQQGQFTAALGAASKGERILRERTFGSFWEISTLQMVSSWALAWRGNLRNLRTYQQDMRADAEARGDVFALTNLLTGTAVWGRLLDDEPDKAREDVALALARWPMKGMQIQHLFALISDGIISIYERDASCLERIDSAWPKVRRSLLLQNQLLRITMLDIRARLALLAGAEARARKEALSLAKEGAHWSSPLAISIRAQLGDDPEASWETALRYFNRADMALHAAAARHGLGNPFKSSLWVRDNRPAAPAKLLAALLPAAR